MRRLTVLIAITLGCALLNWSADWLTDGGNPQRTAWQRDEKTFTKNNVRNMKLLWKLKLDNQPREMHALFPPLIVERVTTNSGFRQIAIVAGVTDNLYAMDAEQGTLLWSKHFESTWKPPEGGRGVSTLCPGGLTATPVIGPTQVPGKYTVYAASWDGFLHQLNVADGEEMAPPAKFMPANGKPYALNLWNGVIYTTTAQGCGGNPNKVYAYDLATRAVSSFSPGGGGMWGRTGPAIGNDGTIYAGTGDGRWDPERSLYGSGLIGVKQDPETKALRLESYYGPSNAVWLLKRDLDMAVTPAVFNYKGREMLVTSSKECRIFLLDTKELGGEDHRTPIYRTPRICNDEVNFVKAGVWGAMASWEDSKGARWVLAPFFGPKSTSFRAPIEHGEIVSGAIAAFKVEARKGKLELIPAWISRDMDAEPPVIAAGIVFAYGSGGNATWATPERGLSVTTQERIAMSKHAVLYALDAETGNELWSSGDEIASWNHFSGLSLANGRVYIATYDGFLYCFGIKTPGAAANK